MVVQFVRRRRCEFNRRILTAVQHRRLRRPRRGCLRRRARFFGPVVYAEGKRIRLGPLAATRIPGPERKYEEKFYARIEETRGYVFEDDKLTLYNEEREPVMVLARIKVEAPKP